MANIRKLKGIMAEAGFSQKKLSETINMSRSSFNMKMNEKRPFTFDEACKICDALGIEDPQIKCQIFLS